jgi:hypothetical protein
MTISHVMVAKVLALTGGALCNDEGVHLVLKAKEKKNNNNNNNLY